MTNESEVEKQQLIQRIENLNAFYLFCKQSFKDAMDLFLKLETGNSIKQYTNIEYFKVY